MRRLLRWGGGGLALAAAAYFVVFARRTLAHHDLQHLGSVPMAIGVAIAAVSCASVVPTSSWAWGVLLRGTGVKVPTLRLNMILGLTQMAKYVPGNVGQYLGRGAMSVARGVPGAAVLVTLLVEMLLAIAAAGVVGFAGLALAARGTATLPVSPPHGVALAALCLGAGILGLGIAIARPPWLFRFAPSLAAGMALPAPGARALVTAFVVYAANYLSIGGGLYAIAFALFREPPVTIPLFVGVLALSWLVGFAAPGAPAGLGIREGVMAALLVPALEGTRALEIIVAFRVATTLGDLLAFAWGGTLYLREARMGEVVAPTSPGSDPRHEA